MQSSILFRMSDCLLTPLPMAGEDLNQSLLKCLAHVTSLPCAVDGLMVKSLDSRHFHFIERAFRLLQMIYCFKDLIAVSPTLLPVILHDLQPGHLGVDKLKSLEQVTYYYSEMNAVLPKIAKDCQTFLCKQLLKISRWLPWLFSCELWNRVHVN